MSATIQRLILYKPLDCKIKSSTDSHVSPTGQADEILCGGKVTEYFGICFEFKLNIIREYEMLTMIKAPLQCVISALCFRANQNEVAISQHFRIG